jgi:hypothetical protein
LSTATMDVSENRVEVRPRSLDVHWTSRTFTRDVLFDRNIRRKYISINRTSVPLRGTEHLCEKT